MINNRPYTFDRVTRLVIGAVIAVILIYLVIFVKGALIPFFIAWFLAYLINPIVLYTKKILHLKSKLLAIGIVLTIIGAIISLFLWAFVPRIIEESQKGLILLQNSTLPDYIKDYFKNLEITTDMASKGLSVIFKVINTSVEMAVAILGFFLVFIYLIFILKDFETISSGAMNLIPDKFRENANMIAEDVKEGMSRYFRGQALVALFVGILLSVGFSIISLPMGIVLGLFIGMLNFIPYLQVIGIIPMILVSILKAGNTDYGFWITFGSAMLVLCIVQIIQDTIIVPKIMGKVTGLNPAIILLSLSVWGLMLGVIGMIIALPLTTVLLSYYKRFVVKGKKMGRTPIIEE